MEGSFEGTVEVVRGRLGEERAAQLVELWSDLEGLEPPEARRRLAEAVCVAVDGDGRVAGVGAARPQQVPLIGNRMFWTYRDLARPEASEAEPEMIRAAFSALEEECDPNAGGPIGLYVPVPYGSELARRPEAVWPDTGLLYAGLLPDGGQARISYFEGATIGPPAPSDSPAPGEWREMDADLDERYRLEPFEGSGIVGPSDVLAFWEREAAVPAAEAQRRVHEVLLVALERTEGIVGVATTYLRRHPQLAMDMFHFRLFVGRAHRRGNIAFTLALRARDLLEQRFTSGEDTRGSGIVYEVENPILKTMFNGAVWRRTGFTFIGMNTRGDHVRVRYFSGARVPASPGPDEVG